MSTIASPRDPGTPLLARRIPSSQGLPTRPSLDIPMLPPPRSPSPSGMSATNPNSRPSRSSRAALREYYKLPKPSATGAVAAGGPTSPLPEVEVTDPLGIQQWQVQNPHHQHHQHNHGQSEVPAGELDAPGFSAEAYVARALAESSLEELLRTYARVVGEARALDAEKKALVYDNYSKLISATETIRKMRSTMDPLNPMASTLDPAIAQIYAQASSIRDALRESIPPPTPPPASASQSASDTTPTPVPSTTTTTTTTTTRARRLRTKQLALAALEAPGRVRALMAEGRGDEARRAWETPRRLLVLWRERGLGGAADVEACIADGDAALRGDRGADGEGEEEEEERGGGD